VLADGVGFYYDDSRTTPIEFSIHDFFRGYQHGGCDFLFDADPSSLRLQGDDYMGSFEFSYLGSEVF